MPTRSTKRRLLAIVSSVVFNSVRRKLQVERGETEQPASSVGYLEAGPRPAECGPGRTLVRCHPPRGRGHLSLGEKKRVAIATVLSMQPAISRTCVPEMSAVRASLGPVERELKNPLLRLNTLRTESQRARAGSPSASWTAVSCTIRLFGAAPVRGTRLLRQLDAALKERDPPGQFLCQHRPRDYRPAPGAVARHSQAA